MTSMRFLAVVFWEFVQNVPLVAGFIVAIPLWQQGQWALALICVAAGSLAGALVIRVTESRIVQGHREPLRVVAANAVIMAVLMTVFVVYLAADWSSWGTDLFVGPLAGIVLSVAQDLAAGEPIGVRHCVALGCAIPLALIGVRALMVTLPVPANILIVTAVVTLIVALVDYGPLASATQERIEESDAGRQNVP